MGNLDDHTRVDVGEGRLHADISPDWQAWGANGGYLAAIALRAAATSSPLSHPASIAVHYLNAPAFGRVELEVAPLRSSKRTESLRVGMRQGDIAILEALVWLTEERDEGLQHEASGMPDVPPPEEATLWSHDTPYPIWRNVEARMVGWPRGQRWEDRSPGRPERCDWFRFKPVATFDDPFADAARSLVAIDSMMFSAAALAYEEPMRYFAPSLDLSVQFHRPAREHEWLLCDARSDVAARGLVAGSARTWTPDGKPVASGAQQMLSKALPDVS